MHRTREEEVILTYQLYGREVRRDNAPLPPLARVLPAKSANLTVSEVSSKMRPVVVPAAWPRRLEAQDTALSRPRHGFESRRGHPISLPRSQ
jgi:hypothetical protein